MKLNLGCRTDVLPGWTNLDYDKSPNSDDMKNVQVNHNLDVFPYPFKDNSVEEIRFWNVLEHLKEPKNVMSEIHRICKNGAKVHLKIPHFSQGGMWGDETHRYGCSTSFVPKAIEFSQKKFRVVSMRLNYRQVRENMGAFGRLQNALLGPLINLRPNLFERYFLYWFGGVEELEYWLEVVK